MVTEDLITVQHNKYNNRKFEILREFKKWDTETWSEQRLLEKLSIDLLSTGFQKPSLKKKISSKNNKMRHACMVLLTIVTLLYMCTPGTYSSYNWKFLPFDDFHLCFHFLNLELLSIEECGVPSGKYLWLMLQRLSHKVGIHRCKRTSIIDVSWPLMMELKL